MQDIAGRVALVTGGAQGIGFGTAGALGRMGARVVLADLDQDRLRAAEEELAGSVVATYVLDVGDRRVGRDGPWTVPELAAALGTLDTEDPFDRLATALGRALGAAGRDQLEAMVNARLDAAQ